MEQGRAQEQGLTQANWLQEVKGHSLDKGQSVFLTNGAGIAGRPLPLVNLYLASSIKMK